jgi:N-acetylmuramoyl-L-alanine amidase
VAEEIKSVDTSNEEELDNKRKEESVINKKIVVRDPGHSSNGNKEMEKLSPDSDIMKIATSTLRISEVPPGAMSST